MKISFKSSLGEEVSFTDFDDVLRVQKIEGLSPQANIEIAPFYDSDGGTVVSMRMDSRRISMLAVFSGEDAFCRKQLNSVFVPKVSGTLFIDDGYGSYKIDCITEGFKHKFAENDITAIISLVCPDPYFAGATEQKITTLHSDGQWTFPFEIPQSGFTFGEIGGDRIARVTNSGAIKSGGIFEILARANVYKPKLQNINTYEWFELDMNLLAHDRVVIDTNKGRKSVKLVRGGVELLVYKIWRCFFGITCF
ncbi:MAG: phage tail family protein [Oscillospiraceae bacterium]|nr:phage tail family protein [Oscillospiraceae bacterium]